MAMSYGPDWSHLSGQSWATTSWTPEKVLAAPDPVIALANYIEQALGVGFPTMKDLKILRKRCNEIFDHYPRADYRTMCRVVQYNKKRKRKFARVYTVIDSFREAKMAGFLPELDAQADVRARVAEILKTERDPEWRARFLTAPDDGARQFILDEYEGREDAA